MWWLHILGGVKPSKNRQNETSKNPKTPAKTGIEWSKSDENGEFRGARQDGDLTMEVRFLDI